VGAGLRSKDRPTMPVGLPQAEQRESERQSSMVNKAFETLRDPLLRGLYLVRTVHYRRQLPISTQYLCARPQSKPVCLYQRRTLPTSRHLLQLSLHGCHIDEAESSRDPAFLMEIMDVNERLEEANSDEACCSYCTVLASHLRCCSQTYYPFVPPQKRCVR
jgi:DnaJ-domain-containing protein 1